jgi:hypothetical protein
MLPLLHFCSRCAFACQDLNSAYSLPGSLLTTCHQWLFDRLHKSFARKTNRMVWIVPPSTGL